MEDTSHEIRDIQQKIRMSLTEEERFRRCGELFDLVRAFVLERTPAGLSQEEQRSYIFREQYGYELPRSDVE